MGVPLTIGPLFIKGPTGTGKPYCGCAEKVQGHHMLLVLSRIEPERRMAIAQEGV